MDSAGGPAKLGRDRNIQAILPLQGKVVNAEKNDISKLLGNKEIKNIISALGCGIGDTFDINKLKYHKIIIMTDADVHGKHIQSLLMTFFYRQYPEIVNRGYLYIAVPPLFRIASGKNVDYVMSVEDKDKIVERYEKKGAKYHVQRYKGLGEMNFDQLRDTTMDVKTRLLYKVSVKHKSKNEKMIEMMMSDKGLVDRKAYITKYAKTINVVENL